jgi:hypothetical protein
MIARLFSPRDGAHHGVSLAGVAVVASVALAVAGVGTARMTAPIPGRQWGAVE